MLESVGYFLLSTMALFLGTILLAILNGVLARRDPINLHVGTAYGVAGLGALLYLVWGWTATVATLAVLTLWTLVGGLLGRRNRGGGVAT